MSSLKILIVILMVLTLCVVIAGIVILGMNKKLNKKYGNKLMTLRVAMQAIIIVMLACLYFIH
jgi:amino acid permease